MTKIDKKKVLLFADWYYPAFKAGGPVQSCRNIVKTMGDRFQFFVLTSDRDLGDSEPWPDLPANQWLEGPDGEKIFYAAPGYLNASNLIALIRQIEPAVIYFNSMFSSRYTLLPLWTLQRMRYKGKVVIAPRGMLHEGAMMRKSLKKKLFLQAFRLSGWPRKLVFHATDDQEQKDIRQYFPLAKDVRIVSNIPHIDEQPALIPLKQRGELRMVFISRIHPKKNLDFILQTLADPYQGKIVFDVYGEADDAKYDHQCKSMAAQLPPSVQVRFKGPVSHKNVFETLYQYHLFVLPTLGENFGHAIFEALSAARPVLISDKTPWRQLPEVFAGWDLPLQNAGDYRAAIQQSLNMEQQEFSKWVKGARQYAMQFVNRSDFKGKYAALFQ